MTKDRIAKKYGYASFLQVVRMLKYDLIEKIEQEFDDYIEKATKMKYRLKSIEFEAEVFDGENNPFGLIRNHQCDYLGCKLCGGDNRHHFFIHSSMGNEIVKPGDYIIESTNFFEGYFALSKEAFDKNYEPIY